MEFLKRVALRNLEKKWVFRRPTDTYDRDEYYRKYPTRICLKIHHGGFFTSFPCRKYMGGRVNYVDLVEPDMISVIDLDRMMLMAGYTPEDRIIYQYLIPGQSLDLGLRPLSSDDDMQAFLPNIGHSRLIRLYTIHGTAKCLLISPKKPDIVIEEIEDEPPKCKKQLFLEWYSSEGEQSNVGETSNVGDTSNVGNTSNVDMQVPDCEDANGSAPLGGDAANIQDELHKVEDVEAPVVVEAPEDVEADGKCDNQDDASNTPVREEGRGVVNEPVIVEVVSVEMSIGSDCGDNQNGEVNGPCGNVAETMNMDVDVDMNVGEELPDEDINSLFENFDPFFGCDIFTPNTGPTCQVNEQDQSYASMVANEDEDRNSGDRYQSCDQENATQFNDVSGEEEDASDGDHSSDTSFVLEDNVNTFQSNLQVDMQEFVAFTDPDVEWMSQDQPMNQVDEANTDFVLNVDMEDIYSADDEEGMDSVWKQNVRKMRNLGKDQGTEDGVPNFYVGQVFPSKKGLRESIVKLALLTRRHVKVIRNDATRVRAICQGAKLEESDCGGVGGDNKGKAAVEDSLKSVKIPCPWVLFISKQKDEDTWLVKTFNDTHICDKTRSIASATAFVLSKEIIELVKNNPTIPIEALQRQMSQGFEIGISRQKAFRAKQVAMKQIRGDYVKQYERLRDYALELQRTNPGTTVKLDFERNTPMASTTRKFRRVYVCIGALKKGFKDGKRDFLGLDGCFMKGPFPGQLLTAVGMDGNNGIFPLAYAIVETENYNSWTWFLENLGDDLGLATNSNFTFISDRQKGLIPAISTLFPAVEHRYCVRHIHENMKANGWKGEAYLRLVWKCATATTAHEFGLYMNELKDYSLPAYTYLAAIPPHHWARSHFTGRCHSDVVLNNICEVFNAQLVDARDKPVITALEYVREYIMKRLANVQSVIDKTDGLLTPWCTTQLEGSKKEATKYRVLFNGDSGYQVSGPWDDQQVVDMHALTCTCRSWEITGIPCKHAIATIWNMRENNVPVNVPELFVHEVYRLSTWKAMYSNKIHGLLGPNQWPRSDVPIKIIPPVHHKQAGRPRKRRLRSLGEDASGSRPTKLTRLGKSVTCDLCKQKGHNSRTCRGQPPPGPSSRSQNTSRGSRGNGRGRGRGRERGVNTAEGTGPSSQETVAGPSQQGQRSQARKFRPTRGRGVGSN